MQTTDDLLVVTGDTLADINISLSGGDLAVRACLPGFSFFLNESTPDANGQLDNGGYFWSDGTSWIPLAYAPASGNYSALPLTVSPAGGPSLFANFFNDGSVRITGQQGVAIPAGNYTVQATCIIYNARGNPLAPPVNVLVSDANCTNNAVANQTPTNNFRTFYGNYYEYFALDYYDSVVRIVGVENCYPASNDNTTWFQGTMLASYYELLRSGASLSRLNYIQALDSSLAQDSYAVLRDLTRTNPSQKGVIQTNQQEPGLAVSRLDPTKMAVGLATEQTPINRGGFQSMFTLDGGFTWDTNTVDLVSQVGIPGTYTNLPYPQLCYNQTWNCSNSSGGTWHCPPLANDTTFVLGWEYDVGACLYAFSGGDTRLAVDTFDVFWRAGLYEQGPPSAIQADEYVAYSVDYGQTWSLAGDIRRTNGSTYSYDYNVVAAGPDASTGSQFCVALKVDKNQDELILFGVTEPVELNCFHTSVAGIVDSIDRVKIPGTEPGHYGGMAIGREGTIYYVMQGMQTVATDPDTHAVIGVGNGPLGSNVLGNVPIMFTTCTPSPGVVCKTARVIARTDFGYWLINAQPQRGTWAQPNIVVDKNNNLYVLYFGVVRNPLPDAGAFFSLLNVNQQTRLLLIKSCDGGRNWSPPRVINDDAVNITDSFSTPNVHFNSQVVYDPISHSIVMSWMDTRVDPSTLTGTQIYATVVSL
jgi:hypothetical protein